MLGAKRSKPRLGAERMSLQIADNHPETLPFVEAAGKLIQNLGMIELQTYEWISALQTDPMVLEMARRSNLRDRIEVVKKMIQRSQLSSDSKNAMLELWSSVIPHLEVRNIVAHSAVVIGFPNGDTTQAATVKGVMNFKPRDKTREAELISIEEINGSVNATARIGAALIESIPTGCAVSQRPLSPSN
jgi:hypothetical protein